MTQQEVRLWLHLRELRRRGIHFRRQVPIDGYIVDFACYHPKIVIEIDGGQHALRFRARRDRIRNSYLCRNGFRVFRFWNNEIDSNIEAVLTLIAAAVADYPPTPTPPKAASSLPARGRDKVD